MNSFKDLDIDKLNKMFKGFSLYSQERKKDPLVILEVFIPNQNMYWLLTEGNEEDEDFTFFGYCRIHYGEFSYVSFNDFYGLNYDIKYIHHKKPVRLSELKKEFEKRYENI